MEQKGVQNAPFYTFISIFSPSDPSRTYHHLNLLMHVGGLVHCQPQYNFPCALTYLESWNRPSKKARKFLDNLFETAMH
jgi:hypothetical protein